MAPSARSRRLRWVAPFATAAVVALIVAVPGLSAAGTPSLAPLSPAALLAKVQQANVAHLSGTINLSTNLGIPNLSALAGAAGGGGHDGQGFNPTDLLSGSHKALVWLAGPDQSRVALLQSLAESDMVHNGHDVWLWDSTSKKVTHFILTPGTKSATPDSPATSNPAESVRTPQQVAGDLLAHLSPTTAVSVGAPVTVARQKAYQLILAPHAAASTVDHVAIAVDSATGLPLRVEIFAKGQKAAAVTLGFGQINYATPAASEFAFKAPPGSTVTEKILGGSKPATSAAATAEPAAATSADQSVMVGQDWSTVQIFRNVTIPKQLDQYLRAATSVNTSAGPAQLLSTSLVNILVLADGRVAVGAVDAAALEAAIAAAP